MKSKSTTCNNAQLADEKILLRKLLARGKVCIARSDLKSRRVCNAHFVLGKKKRGYVQRFSSHDMINIMSQSRSIWQIQ